MSSLGWRSIPGRPVRSFSRLTAAARRSFKTVGDCPDFAQSAEQNGTVPLVVPGHGRFFSSFAREGGGMEGGMAGQQLSADGRRLGGQFMLGIGPYTCLNNAADTRLNRILTVWEGLHGKTHSIRGRIFSCESAK